MADSLLIELRTEELPPKSLQALSDCFAQAVFAALQTQAFTAPDSVCTPYATPRRLALKITQVLAQQPDRIVEKKGPALGSALDTNGQPSKALEGFMRSAGVRFEQLEQVDDGKSAYFVARSEKKGECLAAHLSEIIAQALKKLPIQRMMRWGDSEHQFVRPVHGLLVLHGANVVPADVLGLHSTNQTLGHRFLSNGPITIDSPENYAAKLLVGKVIVSIAERRESIARQLAAQAQALGAQTSPLGAHLKQAAALLDEVTALVEWPVVYVGEFESEYLDVPAECLRLTMQQNQKYFPLFDATGQLINKFLIVSNMQVNDPSQIIDGNARVIRPRLADARFFYNQDRKNGFAARAFKLGAVVYHHKLGSLGDRAQRLGRVAQQIGNTLNADGQMAEHAALMCKTDLLTDMVGEFPELQGTMGRYYALHEGVPAVIADAIEQHYRPRFSGDLLPQGAIACAVALADKLDSLVGFFGIGQVPTGDKDPFGLRRAALGVLRILMETPLALDLVALVDMSKDAFARQNIALAPFEAPLFAFLYERLRGALKEAGYAQGVVEAVLAQQPTRLDLLAARLDAVRDFLALPEALALAAANKRIGNILKKAPGELPKPDAALFCEDAEHALMARIDEIAPQVQVYVQQNAYAPALKVLASVQGEVDHFFAKVMVNADDPALRANRLGLLKALYEQLNAVADISKLAV